MKTIHFTDGRKPRGRYPHLYLINDRDIVKFDNKPREGVVAIIATKERGSGNWVETEYTLGVADVYAPVVLLQPFNGWSKTTKEMAGEGILFPSSNQEEIFAEKGDISKDVAFKAISKVFKAQCQKYLPSLPPEFKSLFKHTL